MCIRDSNASRSPVSKLVVELMIDDGLGSGPSSIEWSSDNLTWSTLREDGLILWVDWNNTQLFVRVTDGANLQSVLSLEIEVPPDEPVDVDSSENENSVSKGGGGVNTLLAFIVAIAIVILSVFTVTVSYTHLTLPTICSV